MAIKSKYAPSDIVVQNAAAQEVMRYADSNYLWCRHVLGVELNPHQLVWIEDGFEKFQNNLLIATRRGRKSFATAMWFLKQGACKRRSEINIHSPALEQSKRNLRYMTDHILDSEILMAFIERRLGEGLGREHVNFVNGSLIQAKGQASSTDGLGATHQWWEEVDDMDWETVLTRIYPTGSQIKDDYDYGPIRGCRRIATGTIKGQGNLHRLEHPGADVPFRFNVLPKVDCYDGIALGFIPEDDIMMARDVLMTPAQFARTYLCLYTESREYFPSSAIQLCNEPGIVPVMPVEGRSHSKSGRVYLGMDFEGHGQDDEASQTTATFIESWPNGVVQWLWSMEWPVGTPPNEIRRDVLEACLFFGIDGGYGDAYDADFLFDLNVHLYRARATRVDVRRKENRPGRDGWDSWFVKPIRFEGRTKHQMFKRLQRKVLGGTILFPTVVKDHPQFRSLDRLLSQLENIKAVQAQAGYDRFVLIRKALGDDYVDSLVAATWAIEEQAVGSKAAGGAARVGGFKTGKRFCKPKFRSGR